MAEHVQLIQVMDTESIRRAIRRMAAEILERNAGEQQRLIIAGIPTRGVELARRITEEIAATEGWLPELGVVDVSMHRDDLATRGRLTAVEASHLPVDLDGRPMVLVDDVLFTGRSCRAALDAIASFGRPSRIQYAVLVDRGHRELPIHADYVGKTVPTRREDRIRVRFERIDGVPDSVFVVQPLP